MPLLQTYLQHFYFCFFADGFGIYQLECRKLDSSTSNFASQPFVEYKNNGMKMWICQFENCGKMFGSRTMMVRHLRTHTKEKPFICVYCGLQSTRKDNLRQHMKLKHEEFQQLTKNDQESLLGYPWEVSAMKKM